MNRTVWNLHHATPGGGFGGGPWVVPGLYTVRLAVGDEVHRQSLRVSEDPRIDVDPLVRRQWTEMLLDLGEAVSEARSLSREIAQVARRLDAENDPLVLGAQLEAKVRDLEREAQELGGRLASLSGSAQGWIGPLSADQTSQRAFLTEMLQTLRTEWSAASQRLPG
jgi:hypothetical protein